MVPELIEPMKLKRVVIHEENSFAGMYNDAFKGMNPYWIEMLKANPYYNDFTRNSVIPEILQNEKFRQEYFKALPFIWRITANLILSYPC